MYGGILKLTTGIVSITGLHGASLEEVKNCSSKKYYDWVTKVCAPCSDICLYPEIQGTLDRCLSKCPDYEQPSKSAEFPTVIVLSILVACVVITFLAIGIALLLKYKGEYIKQCLKRNRNQDNQGDEEMGMIHNGVDNDHVAPDDVNPQDANGVNVPQCAAADALPIVQPHHDPLNIERPTPLALS